MGYTFCVNVGLGTCVMGHMKSMGTGAGTRDILSLPSPCPKMNSLLARFGALKQ